MGLEGVTADVEAKNAGGPLLFGLEGVMIDGEAKAVGGAVTGGRDNGWCERFVESCGVVAPVAPGSRAKGLLKPLIPVEGGGIDRRGSEGVLGTVWFEGGGCEEDVFRED